MTLPALLPVAQLSENRWSRDVGHCADCRTRLRFFTKHGVAQEECGLCGYVRAVARRSAPPVKPALPRRGGRWGRAYCPECDATFAYRVFANTKPPERCKAHRDTKHRTAQKQRAAKRRLPNGVYTICKRHGPLTKPAQVVRDDTSWACRTCNTLKLRTRREVA